MATSTSGQLTRLCAAGALAYGSYAMVRSPVLPLYARQLGATPEVVGLVVAASTLTGVFLKFPAGAFSDVVGRRVVLVAGACVFALLPLGYLVTTGLAALVIVRLVHGSATALFGPVASATLSDLAPPDQRGRWLSVYSSAQGAGQAAGPVVATALVFGTDFSQVFVASAGVGAVALALVVVWLRPPRTRTSGPTWPRLRDAVRAVVMHRAILATSLAQAGQFFVNGALVAFLPLYAREVVGMSAGRIGWLFGVQTAATLLARPLFGAWSDRIGRRPLVVVGLLLCGVSMAAFGWTRDDRTLLGLAVSYGTGLAVTTAATSALITDVTHEARYGAAHGLFGTLYDVGDAAGPLCAGALVAWVGFARAFEVIGGLALIIALVFAIVSRSWRLPDAPLARPA